MKMAHQRERTAEIKAGEDHASGSGLRLRGAREAHGASTRRGGQRIAPDTRQLRRTSHSGNQGRGRSLGREWLEAEGSTGDTRQLRRTSHGIEKQHKFRL
jgi:hypothetical protein